MKIPIEWLKQYIDIKISPQELADKFTLLGLLLDKPIENDVLDLEHRMDRSDWLSIIGCARDVAAMINTPLKYPQTHKEKGKENLPAAKIKIEVSCPNIVRRFNTRVFKNIKVQPSPDWLKNRLEVYGMPSINNIVDITNYVMIELGQPMHAQDTDKMEKPEIIIRMAKKGEKIVTLLGESVEVDDQTFVLTQNDKPTVIGGIVGGMATAVDKNTKNIILDAGNYDQNVIRSTSRKLKIQNESVLRYDKFLDPRLCQYAIERATYLILELAGGDYYENFDYYPTKIQPKQKSIRLSRIKQISGMDFSLQQVKAILERLEYKTLREEEKSLTVEVPYFRTDVEVEDDLVSDVLRINDYSKIPLQLINIAPPKEITPEIYNFEDILRDLMVNLGAHEHITDPFVASDGSKDQVILENSPAVDKDALRKDIYLTLAPVLDIYKKHGINNVRLFEIGLEYFKNGDKNNFESYKEVRVLQTVFANENVDILTLSKNVRGVLNGLLSGLGIENTLFVKEGSEVFIKTENEILGKLKHDGFKLYIQKLLETPKKLVRIKSDYTNTTKEDISLILPLSQEIGAVYCQLKNYDGVADVEVIDEYLDTKLGKNKKAVLVRIEFEENTNRAEIKNSLIKLLQDKFGISVRR